jgi:tetratricopeptide (TPR) repeat protein/O-antigen ligase
MPKFTKVTWAFLFFVGAFSLATLTSVIPYMSFWGSLERMGGVFTFWHYFIYFLMLTSVLKKREDWMQLFNIMIFVGILSAFYGYMQRTNIEWFVGSGGRSRIFGTIGNPALFAGYQILILFLSLTLLFKQGISSGYKSYYATGALLTLIAAFMTAVRGSIVGIAVGLLAFALIYFAAFNSRGARKAFLGLVTILVVFIVSALMFKNSSFVQSSGYLKRITDFSPTNYTVSTRFWAWNAGFQGWKETPKTILLGWGPENFNVPFSKHFNPKFFRGPGSETLFDRAHNMFVEILVTMGLLGFLTYVWIFIAVLLILWKKITAKSKDMLFAVGFIPLVIAYAIHNSFIFDTSANFISFFTILGFISVLSLPEPDLKTEIKDKFKKQVAKFNKPAVNEALWSVSAIILLVIAGVFAYQVNGKSKAANYATTRAIIAGWSGDFDGAIAKYKESIDYDVAGKYEYRNRLAQFLLEYSQGKPMDQKLANAILYGISEVDKNVNENPEDYLPCLYIARMYVTLGKDDPASPYNDKSLEYSLKARDIAPDFVRTYYEVGQGYLNKKDLERASEAFKKAAELNPDVGLSYWYWGVVELERGNIDFGLQIVEKALFEKGYTPSESELNKLIGAYVSKGDYKKLAMIYENLIKAKPDSPQYHASLAVSYAKLGRLEDAIFQAKEAVRLDPKFESEARSFIQSLGGTW